MANELVPLNPDPKTQASSNRRRVRSDVSTPPGGFRKVSLFVSSGLLVLLFAAILLAIVDNPRGSVPPIAAAPTMTSTPTEVSVEAEATAEDAAAAVMTAEPATDTPVPLHTQTSEPINLQPTATATSTDAPVNANAATATIPSAAVRLAEPRRIDQAGFTFRPASDYALDMAGDSVTLSASDRSVSAGTLLLMRSVEEAELIATAGSDLDNVFSTIIESMSARQMLRSGEPEGVVIGGEAGQAVDLVEAAGGSDLSGRIAVARPDSQRIFLSVGFAPAPVWDAYARSDFDAMLDTVEFFEPVTGPETAVAQVTPPSIDVDLSTMTATETSVSPPTVTAQVTAPPTQTASPTVAATQEETPTVAPTLRSPFDEESVWLVSTNGNFANDIAFGEDNLWVASDGGAVAWNLATGNPVKFTVLDGLSANRLVSAANCPLPGFGVVFASNEGLQVFDTVEGSWMTLNRSNSGMSHDTVAAVYCDTEAEVLVVAYLREGLDIYDAATDEWTLVDETDGLPQAIIRAVTMTAPNTIWFSSQLGLTRYEDGEVTLFNSDNSPMVDDVVTALASNGDTVWLATTGDLYRTDGETWDAYSGDTVLDSNFPNGTITGLAIAGDGNVWIGSDQTQVCLFAPEIGSCIEFYTAEDEGMAVAPLTSMAIDAEGNVYYTTAGAGISRYDGTTWSTIYLENETIPGNHIRDITGIGDGTVWVSTNSGVSQINLLDGRPIRFFTVANSGLLSQEVRTTLPVTTDSAWFGTAGGLHLYDDPVWTRYTSDDGLAGNDVRALAVDSENRIWVGSTAGLSIWTGNEFFNLTTESGLPSDQIVTLLSIDDLMWIGTDNGLLRFQDNQLQVYNTSNITLPSDVITALAQDVDGSLLIGTDNGLARFRDNKIVSVPDIPSEPITDMTVGDNGEVWVVVSGSDLYYFDGLEWTITPSETMLPMQSIASLFVDENENLLLGSNQGGLRIVTP